MPRMKHPKYGEIVLPDPDGGPLTPLRGTGEGDFITTEWTTVTWGERSRHLPQGVNVEMTIRVIDGAPHCMSLRFLSTRPDTGIPAKVVRDFKLEDWIERACEGTPIWRSAPNGGRNLDERESARAISRSRARARVGASYSDETLRQVADVYAANVEGGHPTKAVREAFGMAPSTAQLYVKKARERGFLTIPAPGKAGR